MGGVQQTSACGCNLNMWLLWLLMSQKEAGQQDTRLVEHTRVCALTPLSPSCQHKHSLHMSATYVRIRAHVLTHLSSVFSFPFANRRAYSRCSKYCLVHGCVGNANIRCSRGGTIAAAAAVGRYMVGPVQIMAA